MIDFDTFIGQTVVKTELQNIAGHLDVNVMLRGPSGYGKTTLAKITAAKRGDFDLVSGKDHVGRQLTESSFNPAAVTHIVDECHLVTNPEVFYDLMTRCPFIFCTTDTGELPETLTNRCITLTLLPYSRVELMLIGKGQYSCLTPDVLALIASRARTTPRVMLQICQRVKISVPTEHWGNYFEVKNYLDEIGIFDGGYTSDDLHYLAALTKVGRASASTLAAMINVPLTTITNEIEPHLLRERRITITSRGRVIND